MSLAAPRCCPAERRGPSRVPWRLPALDRRGAAGAARRGGLGEPLRAEGPSTRSGKGRPAPRRGSREPLGEQAPGTRPTGGGDRRGSCCALMRLVAPLVAPYCALLRRVAPRGRDRRGAATDEAPRRGPRESLLTGSRAVNRRVRGPRESPLPGSRDVNRRVRGPGESNPALSRTRLSAGFGSRPSSSPVGVPRPGVEPGSRPSSSPVDVPRPGVEPGSRPSSRPSSSPVGVPRPNRLSGKTRSDRPGRFESRTRLSALEPSRPSNPLGPRTRLSAASRVLSATLEPVGGRGSSARAERVPLDDPRTGPRVAVTSRDGTWRRPTRLLESPS